MACTFCCTFPGSSTASDKSRSCRNAPNLVSKVHVDKRPNRSRGSAQAISRVIGEPGPRHRTPKPTAYRRRLLCEHLRQLRRCWVRASFSLPGHFLLRRRLRYPPGESLHKGPVSPTSRSQALHVQASARTQRMTRDKRWECGPSRSHRPVRAHGSRDREGTCGHATRKSSCLQNP